MDGAHDPLKTGLEAMFRLRRPCANCPFLKEGAIELRPGRLESIIGGLLSDDMSHFQCHKTVHNKRSGGRFTADGDYKPSGREAMCAGAVVYLEKAARPNVAMRFGRVLGAYDPDDMQDAYPLVIEPLDIKPCPPSRRRRKPR